MPKPRSIRQSMPSDEFKVLTFAGDSNNDSERKKHMFYELTSPDKHKHLMEEED